MHQKTKPPITRSVDERLRFLNVAVRTANAAKIIPEKIIAASSKRFKPDNRTPVSMDSTGRRNAKAFMRKNSIPSSVFQRLAALPDQKPGNPLYAPRTLRVRSGHPCSAGGSRARVASHFHFFSSPIMAVRFILRYSTRCDYPAVLAQSDPRKPDLP